MTRGHETARELGARMLILFVPRKFRVYHSLVEVPEKSWLLRWPVGDFPERFGRMVSEISPDIRYVDLTPVLSREARAGRPTYLEDDSHWSAAGHAVVADVIAEWLAAEPPNAGTGSP